MKAIRLCLLLLFWLPVPTYAQLKECAVMYKDYKDHQTTNPTLAYESAKEFLKRCPNRDPNVKKFIDAFEKAAYELRSSPALHQHQSELNRVKLKRQ